MAKTTGHFNLPCPVAYQEIHRETMMALRPELFDGFRLDYVKKITPKFALFHNISMEQNEIPSQIPGAMLKIPTSQYAFGASYQSERFGLMFGRMTSDGALHARIVSQIFSKVTLSANAQITNQPDLSNCVANVDYKGEEFRAQVQLGSDGSLGANYIQSITRNLSMGGEVSYDAEYGKSVVGFGLRYEDEEKKSLAAGQVSSNGMVFLSYRQKLSEKLVIASDLVYNFLSRDVVASVGYCFTGQQHGVRGKIDSNGKVSGFLEERLTEGLKFVLSAEIDHPRKDHKFGFGLRC